jgi:hypothetical protein
MSHEFMLKINDGDGWSERFDRYPELLRPATIPFELIPGWGSARILVDGAEISFSDEDFGFAVVFESGGLTSKRAEEILRDICRNIETLTDVTTGIVPL